MLELINQLDGFDPRGNIKVLMATNRPDTLDPALMRPGRLDRKIEFGLPDLEVGLLALGMVSMATSGTLLKHGMEFYQARRCHLDWQLSGLLFLSFFGFFPV
jgi:ATP-dependent 26S proteasome regulatory subunit